MTLDSGGGVGGAKSMEPISCGAQTEKIQNYL